MRTAYTISAVGHAAVLLWSVWSFAAKPLPDALESFPVDLVTASELTKITAGAKDAVIEAMLNSYTSPGTKVEIGFPDDLEGSQVFQTIGNQSFLNGLHHMMETPSIVRKIFWAAENGYDAVISSNNWP